MKNPQPIEIEEAEVERLIEQAQHGRLDAADQKRIGPILRPLIWLQRSLFETRISLSKLKKILFGKCTEKSGRKPQDPPSESDEGGQESAEALPSDGGLANPAAKNADTPADASPDTPSHACAGGGSDTTRSRGHGRLGVADYPGAETILCTHVQYLKFPYSCQE